MSKSENAQLSRESATRRRVVGFFMFPLALFPFLALVSYNWRDIPDLCIPPVRPTMNLIGMAGDWFAYTGYQLVGLAVWSVPVVCIAAGAILVAGGALRFSRRIAWLSVLLLSSTCLLQLVGHSAAFNATLHNLNIAPNAGGAVGYLLVTRCLARYLSPFGAGMLMVTFLLFALLMLVGVRNIIAALAKLGSWVADRAPAPSAPAGAELDAARLAADEARRTTLAEDAVLRAEKAAAREAARAAREAELQARREEREAKKAAREAERAEREAEKRARQEEILRRREEESAARDRLRSPQPPPPSSDFGDYFPARGGESATLAASVPPPPKRPARRTPATPPPPAPAPAPAPSADSPYSLPPITLLNDIPENVRVNQEEIDAKAAQLIDTLKVFKVNARLAYTVIGPVVTKYALSLEPGTRVDRVTSLSNNLQMTLQATSVRIEAPIPGENAIGIEVPNSNPASVFFREIAEGKTWRENSPAKFKLPLLLGKDAAGNDLVADLAKLPHLLIAGATGQGKSVCLNSIINGLLMCRTPDQLRLIMVDPKRVEFTDYAALPHLLVPVINDTNKVVFGLHWAVTEMKRRLNMFSKAGTGIRNIEQFNNRPHLSQPDMFGGEENLDGGDSVPRTIPYIVIVIDELADIMQAAARDVEPHLGSLLALARATGIHLILATQRPDTKVITGTLKSNLPGRIAFKTSSSIDSRTILDTTGSEQLIGKGDMLYRMSDGRLLRAQGSYISPEEITRIITFIGEQAGPSFDQDLAGKLERIKEAKPADPFADEDSPADDADSLPPDASDEDPYARYEPYYLKAVEIMATHKRASASFFQRKIRCGFNVASTIVEMMEERGVLSRPKPGSNLRDILVDPESLLAELRGEPAPLHAETEPLPEAPPEDDLPPEDPEFGAAL